NSTLIGSQLSLQRLSTSLNPSKVATLPRHHKISSASLNQTNGNVGKVKKDKSFRTVFRRESTSGTAPQTTTWFDRPDSQLSGGPTSPQPIIEHTEQTPVGRSMRVDVSGRLSRPTSITVSTASPSPSLGSRESLASISTPTGSSFEDEPPPLPVKTRESRCDHENTDSNSFRHSCTSLRNNHNQVFDYSEQPPEKPPRPDKNHNHDDSTFA
ncbi:unnamed protein product, partial [Meganyctiphanes norvegica]